MTILTHSPRQPLASYVDALWFYDGHQTAYQKERVLPIARFQIFIDLSAGRGAVSGMQSHYTEIETSAVPSVIGVVFRPGGARGFFQVAASEFCNRVVGLDDVWHWQAAELCDRLCDAKTVAAKFHVVETALLQAMRRGAEGRLGLHPSVLYALREFRHLPHVSTVTDASTNAGLSRRRLTELFREQVGMTPKLYCRLLRFRQVVREVVAGGPVDWASVALAGGYYDQPHLAREFRAFSGMSPGSYVAAERPSINHVRVD